MRITVARETGFCLGVRLAVDAVEQALSSAPGPIHVLGSLIHNQRVVRDLEERGVRLVSDPSQVAGGTLVLPSHGVPPETAAAAQARGIRVIDATCSLVRRAQVAARDLAAQGYQVVIVGDPGHAEVVAVAAWTGGRAVVVGNGAEAALLSIRGRVGVVAQTTQRPEVVEEVVTELKAAAEDVKVEDTLCPTTRRRQQEAHDLAKKVDLMLVVGGRESANTRRLAEVAVQAGARVRHIENRNQLDPRWFVGVETVGVTAGASTPDRAIEEVLAGMKDIEEAAAERAESENTEGAEAGREEAGADSGNDAARPAEPEKKTVRRRAPGKKKGETQAPTEPAPQEIPGEAVGDAAGAAPEAQTAPGPGMPEDEPVTLARGEVIQGRVVAIEGGDVLVDIGGKSEGVLPASELSGRPVVDPGTVVAVGDEITVCVLGVDEKDGTVRLSKRRADAVAAWDRLQEACAAGSVIEAPVTAQVKGGLIADVGVRGFIPASHVGRSFVRDLKPYVGQTLRVRVIELDRDERRVILSERSVLEEEQAGREEEVWDSLEEGRLVTGTVKRLADFGAFVDLGGVDGLLHVSELSWKRVGHPREVVQEGQSVQCKVLKLDRERRRISLGLKQLEADPWESIESKYPPGTLVDGKVVSLASFGAFVELEPGVEGLVHLSQLSDRRVERADQVVKVDDRVRVKVLKLSARQKRLSLSLKEAEQDAERATLRKYMAEQEGSRVTLGEVFGDLFTGKEKSDAGQPEPAKTEEEPQEG
ncbi:MAG: bifunctional 4-hydroxy-3-methylbut-2-enyl diphosphate reductase/30S ribosomal protein S1 [bacterium]|nr:bifunctional 4-hydroxy-3-methylbut-2-enyl diphosphate reductase/30S ribosomal protein S1 [bacterium]